VFFAFDDLDCPDTHELFTDGTNPDGRWQRPLRLERRHHVILSAFRYAVLNSGGLPLTAKIRSLCTAAARKLDESFFFVLDFGLMGGTHRFLGVLPEMICL
jgi:hypothetical protein